MRVKREEIDFKSFVDTFNTYGKEAAQKHVSERYKMQYNTVVKRLRAESEYIFDQKRVRYVLKEERDNTGVFLTVEELSCSNKQEEIKEETENINIIYNDAILNLIVDRFFDINQYVTFKNREQRIIVNASSAKAMGYKIDII
jgi:hypothetical protein